MIRLRKLALSAAFFASAHVGMLQKAAAAQGGQQELAHVFSTIFRSNSWESAESRSGPGSTVRYTQSIRANIEKLIAELEINSVLDAACGDFGWMSLVDMQGASYLGMDVVPELIENLEKEYATQDGSRSFVYGDMTQDTLPKVDLIIARDVLGHLSEENVMKALKNFRDSGARWLLTTTFGDHRPNFDIANGSWRPINLVGAPYNLGQPVARIPELGQWTGSGHADKALGLWDLSQLSL